MQPCDLPLSAAAEAIAARRLSSVELVDSVIERAGDVQPQLGAFVGINAEAARTAAMTADVEIAAGRRRGPLHGIPMGMKDLVDVAGYATSASSRVRDGHRAERDSTITTRLGTGGAILLGKTHTHEFAYGLTTPQTRNARNQGRIAGGSSGGSAVAVASGGATFAIGTDTGGSIRVPSALNGVVGLKPTYGLVPRTGVTAMSWSLDHVGPITRTVADAALVLSVLAGYDPQDPASVAVPGLPRDAPEDRGLEGVGVGIPQNYYVDHLHPDVAEAVSRASIELESLGARLVEVEIPLTRYIQATQWGLMVPEASAHHESTLRSMPERYGDDVRVLLEAGTLVSAGDYLRAQRARVLMRRAWYRSMADVDVIVAPTVPITAVPTSTETITWSDGTSESVADAYVRLSAPANLTGRPALTLPVGLDAAGLPIGLQLIGHPLRERTLLQIGHAYETTRGPAHTSAPAYRADARRRSAVPAVVPGDEWTDDATGWPQRPGADRRPRRGA